MRNAWTKALVGIAAIGLLMGAAGCGHGRCGHDPERMQQRISAHLDDVLDDLNATDAQRAQIVAIKDRLLADGKAVHGDHDAVKQTIHTQLKSDRPDAAVLHKLVDERADGMKAFMHKVVDAVVEVHGILTPEQRAQLEKKLERHMKRMK